MLCSEDIEDDLRFAVKRSSLLSGDALAEAESAQGGGMPWTSCDIGEQAAFREGRQQTLTSRVGISDETDAVTAWTGRASGVVWVIADGKVVSVAVAGERFGIVDEDGAEV
jgi:hypothetical protein